MQSIVRDYTFQNYKCNTIADRFYESILLIYPVIKPFYVFSSGMLQPADMFLIACFFMLAVTRKSEIVKYNVVPKAKKIMLLYLLFLCYQYITNVIWFLYLSNSYSGSSTDLLKAPFFSVFNFFAILTCVMIYERIGGKMFYKLAQGCFLSSLIVFALTILNSSGSIRSTGGFNNPNQLGYFGVLLLTGIILFEKYMKPAGSIITAILSLAIIAASLSKAAIFGAVVLILLIVSISRWCGHHINLTIRIFLIIVIVLVIYFLFFDNFLYLQNNTLYSVRNRIDSMFVEDDTSLAVGRGYNRLYEMSGSFLWGKGEGAYHRFETLTGKEIHSSYMTVLVSYGLLGFFLYFKIITGMLFMGKSGKLVSLCLFSGVFVYWLTHQGLRNSVFWIFLAAYMLSGSSEIEHI